MRGRAAGAGLLGKAPWRDEFLRASRLGPELRELDDWIFRNAAASTPESGHPPYAFSMTLGDPHGARPLAGVVSPSRDRAGRAYPLVVAAPLEADLDARPEHVPLVLEPFWEVALELLAAAQEGPLADGALDRLAQQPLEADVDAVDLYGAWIKGTTSTAFCASLQRPLDWLAGVARTLARRSAIAPTRLPLGPGAGSLCFWLDLAARLARSHKRTPSFFWSHDGEVGEVLLAFGAPPDTTLGALWRSDPGAPMCDFTRPGLDGPRADTTIEADVTLASFLDRS